MLRGIDAVRSQTLSGLWQRTNLSGGSLPHVDRRLYSVTSPSPSSINEPPPGQDKPSATLPRPPILDAVVVDVKRRMKHQQPKPRQKAADLTEFQKRLAANPHGDYSSYRHCCRGRLLTHRSSPRACLFRAPVLPHGRQITQAFPFALCYQI